MRHKITCSLGILLMLIGTVANAQGYNTNKWRFSDPKQFGFTVQDVHFFDNNFGIAVGANGGIARTTNGGAKWIYGPFTFLSPAGLITSGSFNDVHVATSTVAYAVGSNGMMAKSTNGGQDWSFVATPLFPGSRNINSCWFVNKDTGYIGGQWNTLDSIPKLYRTRNGGATWDSIAAPASNGSSKVGYINNPNYPPIDMAIDAKVKEIQKIQFSSTGVGYICGGGFSHFPSLGIPTNATTANCVGTGTAFTTTSHNASLLWKFENGVLTDYSISKERLGYTGYPAAAPFNCSQKYGNVTQTVQQFRALNIINDSLIVMMSFNNNVVVRIRTGKNDSTQNINRPAVYEKGRFEILNTGFSGTPFGYPSVPLVQVLAASNPYHMKRAANGKLFASAGAGNLWTSIDTGRNWVQEKSLPQGRNYSAFSTWAMDILPNGKIITMGQGGVTADSIPGGPAFTSTYVYTAAGGNKVDFVDCNNGIVTGGGSIAVTTNGGNSWVAKDRPDFINSFYNISGFSYARLNKAYFAVSNGTIYGSADQATTLDPIYSDFNFQMNDVVGIGNDTIYAVGYSQFSVPTASRKSTFFRSTNAGTTWQAIDIAATTTTPAFTAPTINRMAFPSRQVGYVSGSRNAVYKTTDGGTTWTNISPFPALNFGPAGFPNTTVTYTSICALNDNTVFVIGNMFTSAAVKRVYKTIDGGTTWTDITGNIPAFGQGNMTTMLFSDANNGYVAGGNVMYITNNGGTSWTMEAAPHGNIHNAMGFAPRTVPAGIPFANRKLFLGTIGITGGVTSIMEFGDTSNVNVNATETVVNATCTNLTAGSITVNATGGLVPYTYSINGGAFQSSNSFTGLTQGAKTIVIKDNFCGTITKTVNVGFTDNLTVNSTPTDTSVCAGAPVQLVATSAAGATYSWIPAAGLSSTTISNPVATVNSNASYTVTATLGTCVKTKVSNITIKPNPTVNAGGDKTILDGDQVQLDGSGNLNVTSITWTPAATLTGANTFTPIAKPNATTTYTLTVRDANNCTATDNTVVTVIPYCVKPLDAFTPNGDGINDKWLVTNGTACISTMAVAVYNRYGGLVYKNDGYQNNWDGTYEGKPVADGTYYYQISYKLFNGTTVRTKGNVTILR
ncbi:MAG: gliding motility-associated C-terminal domain-containing protein [Bacteroidota bacterium]